MGSESNDSYVQGQGAGCAQSRLATDYPHGIDTNLSFERNKSGMAVGAKMALKFSPHGEKSFAREMAGQPV